MRKGERDIWLAFGYGLLAGVAGFGMFYLAVTSG